jgi:broad specificity phosphatase PhoE
MKSGLVFQQTVSFSSFEIKLGPTIPEWKTIEELHAQFPSVDVSYQPISVPKHPETRCSLKERAKKTMLCLTQERYPNQNILIVTHGASVEALALGLYPTRPVDWVTCRYDSMIVSYREKL